MIERCRFPEIDMMRALAACLAAITLAGCQTYERMKSTEFVPLGGGVYAFSIVSADTQLDDPEREQYRIENLELYLSDNGLCRGGYVITERTPIKTADLMRGSLWKVHYRVRCK